jgi:hypothetical protein
MAEFALYQNYTSHKRPAKSAVLARLNEFVPGKACSDEITVVILERLSRTGPHEWLGAESPSQR